MAERGRNGLEPRIRDLLTDAGYVSDEAIRAASDDELLAIKGIGEASLQHIREATAGQKKASDRRAWHDGPIPG